MEQAMNHTSAVFGLRFRKNRTAWLPEKTALCQVVSATWETSNAVKWSLFTGPTRGCFLGAETIVQSLCAVNQAKMQVVVSKYTTRVILKKPAPAEPKSLPRFGETSCSRDALPRSPRPFQRFRGRKLSFRRAYATRILGRNRDPAPLRSGNESHPGKCAERGNA